MTDEASCSKGHPKTPENWANGRCRECKRVADATRRGTQLRERRVYDPERFPCGHPRIEDNLTKRRQCRECARRNAAKTAQAEREERIAKYGPGRRPRSNVDPLRYPCGHPKAPENTASNGACRGCRLVRKSVDYYAKQEAAGKARRVVDPERFPCGHPRTVENTIPGGYACKECHRHKRFERYRAALTAQGKTVWKPDPDWFPCGHPRITPNLTKSRRCRACANERALADYREGKRYPTAGDPELIRLRHQAYTQCRRDERADPETWSYVQIIRRDPCSYCGGPGGTRDHVIPMSSGGPNHWSNYTGACQSCNLSKSDVPLLAYLLDREAMRRVRRGRMA